MEIVPPPTAEVIIELSKKLSLEELNVLTVWCNGEMLERMKTARMKEEHEMMQEREQLRLEKESWERLASKLHATQLPQYVTLNVGETTFKISVANLTRIPDTFFSALYQSIMDGPRSDASKYKSKKMLLL